MIGTVVARRSITIAGRAMPAENGSSSSIQASALTAARLIVDSLRQ